MRAKDRFADGTWNKELIVLRNLRSNQMSNCRRHQIPSESNCAAPNSVRNEFQICAAIKFQIASGTKFRQEQIASGIKSSQHLNYPCSALTSSYTHRNNTVFLLAFFKFVHDLHTQLSSCATKRMTECDGATVDIYQ